MSCDKEPTQQCGLRANARHEKRGETITNEVTRYATTFSLAPREHASIAAKLHLSRELMERLIWNLITFGELLTVAPTIQDGWRRSVQTATLRCTTENTER